MNSEDFLRRIMSLLHARRCIGQLWQSCIVGVLLMTFGVCLAQALMHVQGLQAIAPVCCNPVCLWNLLQ